MNGSMSNWLSSNPNVSSVTIALTDVNGSLRGKRVPATHVEGISEGGFRMPFTAAVLDIWGRDVVDNELLFASGDADGICMPTERGILPCPWTSERSAITQVTLTYEDGTPFLADPRQALAQVVNQFSARGLRPVVATELEFYLTDPSKDIPQPPRTPNTGRRLAVDNVLSVLELNEFSAFLDDVYRACQAQGIPADAAISENGAGQFEINLLHTDDALRAADDAILFKHLVRGVARQHGFAATFMAKPYGDCAGSGLHVHFSILDEQGQNIFDNGAADGTDMLRHAVGGLLATMQENTLVFAPHLNSYRRLRPGAHAPTGVAWGYENRTAAIRIPGGNNNARRIEHRVAGGDTNPYLVLAAILGGALIGIEDRIDPPAPLTGNVYDAEIPSLPLDWLSAIEAFQSGPHVTRIFDPLLQTLLVQTKRQELATFLETVTEFEYSSYLEVV